MKRKIALLLTLCMVLTMMTAVAESAAAKYKAGTYTAVERGMKGDVSVTVTFAEDAITEVVVSENESTGVKEVAVERIPAQIVEHQSLAIDTVTGATVTSSAILRAVKKCVEEAGGDVAALQAVELPKSEPVHTELTTQAVVVGGGVAGMASAISLYENGVDVILLEQNAWLGGEAMVCGGKLIGTGADAQKKLGLEEDPEDFYQYYLYITEGMCNQELQREVVYRSADVINWFEGMGVEFADMLTLEGDTDVPRCLNAANEAGGKGLMLPMVDHLHSLGVNAMLETRATKILQDETGAISGVEAVNQVTGDTYTIKADAVVMATGDTSMTTTPALNDWGRQEVKSLGAKFLQFSDVDPYGAIYGLGGLYLTPGGERYTSEFGFYGTICSDLARKTGNSLTYMIVSEDNFKQNTTTYFEPDGGWYTWEEIVGDGYTGDVGADVFCADTLEETLAAAGIDVETGMASIKRYNELCAAGVDTDFGKDPAHMFAIEGDGPFYAYEVLPREFYTEADPVGNPVCNTKCQILAENGEPIPGLYGAGALFNTSIRYRTYPGSGSYILFGLAMGRITGESIAADLAL